MKKASTAIHIGRDPHQHFGAVNIPPYRASTFIYESLSTLWGDSTPPYAYGRDGTPSMRALQKSIATLEGGTRSYLTPSGLSAIALAILAVIKPNHHILVSDSVYTPTRHFCEDLLARFGIVTEFYDPLIGRDIATLLRPETCLIFTESPGSLTFEVQDIPAIAKVARAANIPTIIDNTWGALINFDPFAHGIDISVQALTKYLIGHADALLGSVTTNDAYTQVVEKTNRMMGYCAAADDIYLGLRGLRTLPLRLERHCASALTIANWLRKLPFVREVMFPPQKESPGHKLWKRDFTGGCGLLGLIIDPRPQKAFAAMADNMRLFRMGYSWGGYESLIVPYKKITRTTSLSLPDGQFIRLHVGLEDVGDLQQDLSDGFARARFKI